MLRNLQAVVVGLAVVMAACAHTDPRASPVGSCLTAEIGEWTPPTELSPQQQPPASFELLEETYTEGILGRGQTIVRPVIEGYSNPRGWWEMPTPDSLVVTWTNGFEGIRLRLTRAADAWTGTANPMTDVWVEGQATPTAPVTVEPVACT